MRVGVWKPNSCSKWAAAYFDTPGPKSLIQAVNKPQYFGEGGYLRPKGGSVTYGGYEITAYYKLWTRWQIDDTGAAVRLLDAENPQATTDKISYDVRKDDVVLDGLETLKSVERAREAIDELVGW
jgi:hypothetical protein